MVTSENYPKMALGTFSGPYQKRHRPTVFQNCYSKTNGFPEISQGEQPTWQVAYGIDGWLNPQKTNHARFGWGGGEMGQILAAPPSIWWSNMVKPRFPAGFALKKNPAKPSSARPFLRRWCRCRNGREGSKWCLVNGKNGLMFDSDGKTPWIPSDSLDV